MSRLTFNLNYHGAFEYVLIDGDVILITMLRRNYKVIKRVLQEFNQMQPTVMLDGRVYDIHGISVNNCSEAYVNNVGKVAMAEGADAYVEVWLSIDIVNSFVSDAWYGQPLCGRLLTNVGDFAIDVCIFEAETYDGEERTVFYLFQECYDFTEWIYDEDTKNYYDMYGNCRAPGHLDKLYFDEGLLP